MIDANRLAAAYETARRDLLAERVAAGHWVGELSSSALSTATAVSALSIVAGHTADEPRREACRQLARRGIEWLARCQNDNGGWGDTDKSLSNVATTMLVCAAFHLGGAAERHASLLARAEGYIDGQGGAAGLKRRYGGDKTLAVPVLTNRALAGTASWREVPPLPFELACLPYPMLRFLRLPVVSYALPALVAIGQARFFHRAPRNPITWLVRRLIVRRSLAVLRRMQPSGGGFLEAVPLTSFVVMSLAATPQADHAAVRDGVRFLLASIREDGSWPINANLATWHTSGAVSALAGGGDVDLDGCLDWLLSCQHCEIHPFTHTTPGGWGWSDLSGAVPDADDTSGALVALKVFHRSATPSSRQRIEAAVRDGLRWLLDLQNADGGWPTFCRGWGALPFDRSAPELTAHALRAVGAWRAPLGRRADRAVRRGFDYLSRQQRGDGSWVPLWFGNQFHPREENPTYGTARVLLAYRDTGRIASEPARRGLEYLAASQCRDGGWGNPGEWEATSTEETAVAVEALLADHANPNLQGAIDTGLTRLVTAVESGGYRETAPIGLYFARLWYHERLYPLIFTVGALGQAVRHLATLTTR